MKTRNEIIAQFMGYTFHEPYWYLIPHMGESVASCNLKFHSDWNWLMPVIKEIKNIKWKDNSELGVIYVEIFNYLDDVDLVNTYKHVVKFIELVA